MPATRAQQTAKKRKTRRRSLEHDHAHDSDELADAIYFAGGNNDTNPSPTVGQLTATFTSSMQVLNDYINRSHQELTAEAERHKDEPYGAQEEIRRLRVEVQRLRMLLEESEEKVCALEHDHDVANTARREAVEMIISDTSQFWHQMIAARAKLDRRVDQVLEFQLLQLRSDTTFPQPIEEFMEVQIMEDPV